MPTEKDDMGAIQKNSLLLRFINELQRKGEVYISVKVIAHAKEDKIIDVMSDNTVKVSVHAPAEKGKANDQLISFFSFCFQVPKQNIRILSGHSSRRKLLKIFT